MTVPPAMVTLELTMPVEDIAALRRRLAPGLGRARALTMEWHDDGEGTLAQRGAALVCWRAGRASFWRLEALDPQAPPGAPAPVMAEAPAQEGLRHAGLPEGMAAVQHFAGRVREGLAAGVALRLLEGWLGDGAPVARLALAGPADEVAALGLGLAGSLRLAVPGRSLAAEALARAGVAVAPRRLGAPQLQSGLAPGEAFAQAAGHLLGVLLHHAPAAAAGQTGEPVHQMRVALRRLRALVSVFRPVVACPELDAARPGLKALASALGPARDWDVFLDGTGRRVAAAFADEPGVAVLLAAAEAQRAAAYAALATLLAGPELRSLSVQTALLVLARPWEGLAQEAPADTGAFGAAVLGKRLRRMVRHAGKIDTQPEAALHELRLKAKRLRYAAEVFAPLFPGREAARFLRRLAALQEALGHLNDGAVAAGLMQALAAEGGTGLAGGLVRGFVAGQAGETRDGIARAWKRLRKARVFWH